MIEWQWLLVALGAGLWVGRAVGRRGSAREVESLTSIIDEVRVLNWEARNECADLRKQIRELRGASD